MAIQVSGVIVIDNDRNLNVGVLTATSIDVPPQVISFSPADNASDVSLSSNIVITFNAAIQVGSGNITLRDGSATGTVLETIAVSSGNVSISGAQLTINPSSNFLTGKNIYVVIPDGAFTSVALQSNIDVIDTYNFSTGAVVPTTFSPSDGATDQAVDVNFVITFNDNVAKGSGNIYIRTGSASGSTTQTIDVTSSAVSISGTQVTINPPSNLSFLTTHYIVIEEGCFTNTDGDSGSENTLIDTYNITTVRDVPPLGTYWFDEGGRLVCCASSRYYLIHASNTSTDWFGRNVAVTVAQQRTGCYGWFFPNCTQMGNPGITCMQYWHPIRSVYWTTSTAGTMAIYANFGTNYGTLGTYQKTDIFYGAAFRNISY